MSEGGMTNGNGVVEKSILVTIGVIGTVGVLGAVLSGKESAQILGFCGVICVSLFSLYSARQGAKMTAAHVEEVAKKQIEATQKVAVVAEKVEQVAQAAEGRDAKLDAITKVTNSVHTLVNNAMGVQLHLNAVMARRLSGMTGDVGDLDAAHAAEKLYAEHMVKQSIVDDHGKSSKSSGLPLRNLPGETP